MARRRGVAIIFTLLGVAFFISLAGFATLYLLVGRGPSVPGNATLTIRLGGELAEVEPTDVFGLLSATRTPTVRGIVENLRKAKVDGRVKAVLLKSTGFTTPYWGKIQEIRDAVIDFKSSGKPVYAYLDYGGDRDYYIASAADRVFLMPSATLDLTGVATYELFLRGTLDKIGVLPDLHHVGQYKNAVNTFTETGFTAAHREVSEALNRDLFEQIVQTIADGRKKSADDIRALIDEGPFLAERARAAGLIDDVAYEDEAEQQLRDAQPDRNLRTLESDDYARVSASSLGLNRGPRIAVIYASGAIVAGRSGYDPVNGAVVGSETLIEAIRDARDDSSVRAIVLRIDSPGGSATASDAVWRELMVTKRQRSNRPIIVSMSDLAASGGYYIAMPADAIVAQPSTLTGSIGIFGGKFVTGGAYGKLGANIESTSIGRHAEMNSPARPYNPDELKKFEEYLQFFYDQFVERVADARKSTPEKIDQVAQGRVWTGRQAKERGLVDELGGLNRAIAVARERAGIDSSEVDVVVYPKPRSVYEMLTDFPAIQQSAAVNAWVTTNLSAAEREALRLLRGPFTLFRPGEALALMPTNFLR